jgi:hypothetical protein
MIHQRGRRRIAPLVPFTVSLVRRIHLSMKFKKRCALTRDSAPGWSGIDAGRRVQVGLQVAGIRHFRAGGGHVKRGGEAAPAMKAGFRLRPLPEGVAHYIPAPSAGHDGQGDLAAA